MRLSQSSTARRVLRGNGDLRCRAPAPARVGRTTPALVRMLSLLAVLVAFAGCAGAQKAPALSDPVPQEFQHLVDRILRAVRSQDGEALLALSPSEIDRELMQPGGELWCVVFASSCLERGRRSVHELVTTARDLGIEFTVSPASSQGLPESGPVRATPRQALLMLFDRSVVDAKTLESDEEYYCARWNKDVITWRFEHHERLGWRSAYSLFDQFTDGYCEGPGGLRALLGAILSGSPTMGRKAPTPVTQALVLMRQAEAIDKIGRLDKAAELYTRVVREYGDLDDPASAGPSGMRTFGGGAWDRLKSLHCRKHKKIDRFANTPAELAEILQGALARTDLPTLTAYASCDFTVGRAETDLVWSTSPLGLMPAFVALAPRFDWSGASFETTTGPTNSLNVPLRDRPETPKDDSLKESFTFTRGARGWQWSAYYTWEEDIERRLGRASRDYAETIRRDLKLP